MISIIIPTFNRSNQLNATLFSLTTLKSISVLFEIIIVDNGSTDNTKEIVDRYKNNNKTITIKYFFDKTPGLLTGRHRGAMESSGDILTFIDDDVFVSSEWLNTIEQVMQDRADISLLTGPNLPFYNIYPPKWLEFFWTNAYNGKYCTWLSLMDLGSEPCEIHPNFVWGLNFTIRKSVFEILKGFHPDNIPTRYQMFQGDGETGLTMKAFERGFKALYHPGVMLFHDVPSSRLTKEYFEKRAYYQGVCDSFTLIRYNLKSTIQSTNESSKDEKSSIWSILKKTVKSKLNRKPRIVETFIPEDIQELFNHLNQKEKEGFNFHQKMHSENPIVKEWVSREDFMDYKIPDHD